MITSLFTPPTNQIQVKIWKGKFPYPQMNIHVANLIHSFQIIIEDNLTYIQILMDHNFGKNHEN